MGTGGDMLVRQREAPSGQIAQSCRIGEDLNAGRAVPDQDVASLRLDDHPVGGVIIGHGKCHLGHAGIVRQVKAVPPGRYTAKG